MARWSFPITDMSIHKITKLRYKGAKPAKEFRGKTREKEFIDKMKKEFGLIKKSCGYSITSILDPTVQLNV